MPLPAFTIKIIYHHDRITNHEHTDCWPWFNLTWPAQRHAMLWQFPLIFWRLCDAALEMKKRGFPWKNHLQNISEQCFQISTDVLMIWHDLTNLTIFGYQVYHDLRRFIMIYGVSIQLLGIILTEWTCWFPSTSPGVSHDTSVPGAEV